MKNRQVFTVDEKRFPQAEFQDLIKQNRLKYVPIIDPGLTVANYSPYINGYQRGVYLKNAAGVDLIGKVWSGKTVFLDWTHPSTESYWKDLLESLHDKLQFDGVWLDMNEVSNFCDGECLLKRLENGDIAPQERLPSRDTQEGRHARRKIRDSARIARLAANVNMGLIFIPGGRTLIDEKTVAADAKHYTGERELEFHPLNAYWQVKTTYDYLKTRANHIFPFIISRSTMFGAGKYASHWTGDNAATFRWLELSISQIINANLFGIPFTGADVCGFLQNTFSELCARWYQLGALYPFFRNHNDNTTRAQEPWMLGRDTLKAATNSIRLRYSLIKHYYSLFIEKVSSHLTPPSHPCIERYWHDIPAAILRVPQ
jgi:alpha-glucosidase (family GH31 glycosyl hydrolase)